MIKFTWILLSCLVASSFQLPIKSQSNVNILNSNGTDLNTLNGNGTDPAVISTMLTSPTQTLVKRNPPEDYLHMDEDTFANHIRELDNESLLHVWDDLEARYDVGSWRRGYILDSIMNRVIYDFSDMAKYIREVQGILGEDRVEPHRLEISKRISARISAMNPHLRQSEISKVFERLRQARQKERNKQNGKGKWKPASSSSSSRSRRKKQTASQEPQEEHSNDEDASNNLDDDFPQLHQSDWQHLADFNEEAFNNHHLHNDLPPLPASDWQHHHQESPYANYQHFNEDAFNSLHIHDELPPLPPSDWENHDSHAMAPGAYNEHFAPHEGAHMYPDHTSYYGHPYYGHH